MTFGPSSSTPCFSILPSYLPCKWHDHPCRLKSAVWPIHLSRVHVNTLAPDVKACGEGIRGCSRDVVVYTPKFMSTMMQTKAHKRKVEEEDAQSLSPRSAWRKSETSSIQFHRFGNCSLDELAMPMIWLWSSMESVRYCILWNQLAWMHKDSRGNVHRNKHKEVSIICCFFAIEKSRPAARLSKMGSRTAR